MSAEEVGVIYSLLNVEDTELFESLNLCKNDSDLAKVLEKIEIALDSEIKELEAQSDDQYLMDQLHHYNDLKDSAQAVIGSLANLLGVTVASLHKEFGADNQS